MHDTVTGRIGTSRRRARTPARARSNARRCPTTVHGDGGRARLSRHRRAARAGPAAGAVEAARRARHLHPALRHRRPVGHVCGRAARRRRAQYRTASLREGRASSSKAAARPKSGRKARPKRHVFEWQKGSHLLHPAQLLSPHHQCRRRARAHHLRHHGAEHDEPPRQPRFIFNCPLQIRRALLGCGGLSSSRTTISSPIRCAASPCGAPISSPTSSTRAAAR